MFRDWANRLTIAGRLLFKATQLSAALITIFSVSSVAAVVAHLLRLAYWPAVLGAFALGVLVAFMTVLVAYRRVTASSWLLRGYAWRRAEYTYRVHEDDPNHHTQTITIALEALQPGVNHFENRYQWTGAGRDEGVTVLSPGHRLIGPPIPCRAFKHYYVHLGRELAVGEEAEVKIQQELYDEEGQFEPLLSKIVTEPVDELCLRVVLPKNRPATDVALLEETGPPPSGGIIRQTPGAFDAESGDIHWEIHQPAIGRMYEIRWKW